MVSDALQPFLLVQEAPLLVGCGSVGMGQIQVTSVNESGQCSSLKIGKYSVHELFLPVKIYQLEPKNMILVSAGVRKFARP